MAGNTWNLAPQLFYDGAYQVTEATADGFVSERGVGDDQDLKPGSCTFRVIDDDDLYRPSNVASPLYGQIRQYSRAAAAAGGSVRFTGEIDRVLPGQTDDFQPGPPMRGFRYLDFEVGGTLNRVGRRRDDLTSALFKRIVSYANLRSYFPLEEQSGATRIGNAKSGAPSGYALRVDFGAGDSPGGSAPLVKIRSDSSIGSNFPTNISTTGWQLHWTCNTSTLDGVTRDLLTVVMSNGNKWRWQMSDGAYRLLITDSDGVELKNALYTHGDGGAAYLQFVSFRLRCSVSGGTVTVQAGWNPEATASLIGFTETFSGSLGRPESWNVYGNLATTDMSFGHLAVLTGTTDNLQSTDFRNSLNGYLGETTAARFVRLMSDAGVPFVLRQDTTATSERMGPMPITTLQEQLKEIRLTEGGMIFDRGDNRGVVFATRRYLYEQAITPGLTLTWPDDIAPPMQEEITAGDVYNAVTAKSGGSSATRSLSDGSTLSTDVIGEVPLTVDLNLYDQTRLDDMAAWWLSRSTVPGSRYPQLVVDLDAYASSTTPVLALEPGSVIKVIGRTPDELYLQVLRVRTEARRHRMRLIFTVAPADVFRVGVYNTARYDVQGSTLDVAHNATTTALQVDNLSVGWGSQTPYYVMVGGERMIVTAATAPGATQTLTVIRSTNGVVKSHAAGTPVHIGTNPGRYGV